MKTPFYMLVFKVFHAQRKQIRTNMDDYGLFPGQPKVLRYVSIHEDCKLKDIAEECDIECATASKILTGLEDSGMLTRCVDQTNKRALKVRITKRGEHALALWNTHCAQVEQKALTGFSEEERNLFKSYLCRMYENLSDKQID